jgi:hypothetical protein
MNRTTWLQDRRMLKFREMQGVSGEVRGLDLAVPPFVRYG